MNASKGKVIKVNKLIGKCAVFASTKEIKIALARVFVQTISVYP
ncbi:hypothetical protein GPLA_2954 [Paraglaciecola polaris LMG 21857]|uniref:Uncharacterized protein n=1 Tax=Paraglaciecola polaris LMG 21857 TaxID=1129793 RepID=K6ZU91_9ALTE|nr:hypothetical protein GPLA_2954 [Paraglaciecola polaris LMG 21857]